MNSTNTTAPSNQTSLGASSPVASLGGSAALAGYSGHYWVMGRDAGASQHVLSVAASVKTPNIGPKSGDYFYVLLSVWDSNDNYDQIGFASNYQPPSGWTGSSSDSWDVTWDFLTNCAQNTQQGTNWDVNAANLGPGTTYTFQLKLLTSSNQLEYLVRDGGPAGSVLWTKYITDNAAYLDVGRYHACSNGQSWTDYTDWEEVFFLSQQSFPNWDFFFNNNSPSNIVWEGVAKGTVPAPPHGYYWLYGSGLPFTIANQAFNGYLNLESVAVAPGHSVTVGGAVPLVGTYCASNLCYLTILQDIPLGWSWSVSWCSVLPDVCTSVTLQPPSSAAPGMYYIWFHFDVSLTSGYNGPIWEFDSFMLYTTVT